MNKKDLLLIENLIVKQLKRYQKALFIDYQPNGLHLELDLRDCLALLQLKRKLENLKEA